MKKISLLIHQNYVDNTINELHQSGLLEIINISKKQEDIFLETEASKSHPDSEICANYDLRLTRLIDILKKMRKKPSGLKSILTPETIKLEEVNESNLDENISQAEGLLHNIEKNILENEKKIKELYDEKQKILTNIEKLKYFKDFEFDTKDIGDSEYLFLKIGITQDIENLKSNLKKIDKSFIEYKEFIKEKNKEWSVLIISYFTEKEEVEKISREYLTDINFDNLYGYPKEIIKNLKNQLLEITEKQKKIKRKLNKTAEEKLRDLLVMREQIKIEGKRKDIYSNFLKTDSTYVIEGWVIKKDEEKLKKLIEKTTNNCVIFKSKNPSINPDNPPTYIKTPRWANGFKGLINMFATPKYNEINPTIIMGFFFILFFGVMLGDAGYGLIILILSLFGYFKLGKHSNMFRDWSFMGIWMGIVTTAVGLLTNSFFGDFIPRFIYNDPSKTIYNLEIFGITLPANSIKDPITILVIALIFGLIHLNVGIILGLIQSYKNREYKELITTKSCWIPLQIGGGMLIGYSILDFNLSSSLLIIASILVIIGLIQLMINAGPIGFFDITGYVGDWLSYARLLALGLATAGMALAFNVVAQLLGEMIPFIGIIIMILLLVFAHLVNLGLQALGAGIHSLRLQYVEFFNRFYEGGGHEFSPFRVKRKYTKIKDKKIE